MEASGRPGYSPSTQLIAVIMNNLHELELVVFSFSPASALVLPLFPRNPTFPNSSGNISNFETFPSNFICFNSNNNYCTIIIIYKFVI